MTWFAAFLAAADAYQAAAAPTASSLDAGTDFRKYVFAAYGAVLLLLLLFSVWSVVQVRRAQTKLEHLKERVEAAEKRGHS